jgi:hypothetical protein
MTSFFASGLAGEVQLKDDDPCSDKGHEEEHEPAVRLSHVRNKTA